MQILAETGCYADFTLPSAPDETQVPMINKIYECGLPLTEKMPHRAGKSVEVVGAGAKNINGKYKTGGEGEKNGNEPQLPLIFTGPLIFNWTRRVKGFPVPRIEDGALVANQPMDLARFRRWTSANVTVKGRSDWIFVKLYCHGFFDYDQSACIGEDARRFFGEIVENGEKTGEYKVHFASAREAFNMVCAAINGESGDPNEYRDYRLRQIMTEKIKAKETKKPKSTALHR
jgi:hypothetical protein